MAGPRPPRGTGKTVRVQPPLGQSARPPAATQAGTSGRRKPTRAGAEAIEQAKRVQAGNVVALRPGDQQRVKRSNMLCRHCGSPWWDAVVTVDRDSGKPGAAMTNGEKGPPFVKCHQCGREPRFD